MWLQNTFSRGSIYLLLLLVMIQTKNSHIKHDVQSVYGYTSCRRKEVVNCEKLVTVLFLSASSFWGFPCRCRRTRGLEKTTHSSLYSSHTQGTHS